MEFNRVELEIILAALEVQQKARVAITTDAVIEGDFIRADAALKHQSEREILINRIKQHLKK